MLGAGAGALAAVGAAARYVEGADDVEEVLLKIIGARLSRDAGGGVVEHALNAAAGGARVAAGVAADAPGQLAPPELKARFGRHGLDCLDAFEAVRLFARRGFRVGEHLVAADVLLLADFAPLQHLAPDVPHAVARDAHGDHLFSWHAVLGDQLVQAVGVAGLQKNQRAPVLLPGGDQVF